MSSNQSIATSTTASLSTSQGGQQPQRRQHQKTIFLGVAPSTTEVALHILMEREYGPIQMVRIPLDQDRKSRGFAFITFQYYEHAVAAIEGLDGVPLDGLILHPQWATPRRKPSPRQHTGGPRKARHDKKNRNQQTTSFMSNTKKGSGNKTQQQKGTR